MVLEKLPTAPQMKITVPRKPISAPRRRITAPQASQPAPQQKKPSFSPASGARKMAFRIIKSKIEIIRVRTDAAVFIERGNAFHVFVGQLEIEYLAVLDDARFF